MRAGMPALVLAVMVLIVLAGTASAANFGAHVGLAEDTVGNPYFAAGALVADIDHFLPPGDPQTDSTEFARGIVIRAWGGSHRAWAFARGWVEHLDQDARFVEFAAAVLAAHPSYTTTDVRLGFDYWTVTKHPFSTDFDFLLTDGELHALVAGGLASTDAAGVRTAIDRLLHSADPNAPGLFLQIDAARVYGLLYPQIVRDLEPYYDSYYAETVAGWHDPFPRMDRLLMWLHHFVRSLPPGPRAALEPLVVDARHLVSSRPSGWLDLTLADLEEIVERASGMTGRARVAADIAGQILETVRPPTT